MEKKLKDLGLYIHIPFCVKKCDYCDFLSAPGTETVKKQYVNALITEIYSYKGMVDDYMVPSIFFGGGTPSVIDPLLIEDIMEAVRNVFHIDDTRLEATIEVNPGTLMKDKLMIYKRAGLNRISFGLQSTDNIELKKLGRIHSYEEFKENYDLARKIGFNNINIDLMSALPGQTLESWEKTLNTVIDFEAEHISAYSLIIEEDTPFYYLYGEDGKLRDQLPDEETDRRIYHRTKELLRDSGYNRYEISNYSRDGYECRHNISYWVGTEYLGLGIGASSLLNGARIKNMHDINTYIEKCNKELNNHSIQEAIREEYQDLSINDKIEEFMFLGLRLTKGISIKEFEKRFQSSIYNVYNKEIEGLVDNCLIVIDGDRLALTDYGIDISNAVLSEFIRK
ncbi:MAG TPA: oxygen-independent coproporphyrinogen III oxidase [Clostridiales bacterium]|nr:oxygen-independent coproporphyrinogen III oxidase [Clostridiales bacterium]